MINLISGLFFVKVFEYVMNVLENIDEFCGALDFKITSPDHMTS